MSSLVLFCAKSILLLLSSCSNAFWPKVRKLVVFYPCFASGETEAQFGYVTSKCCSARAVRRLALTGHFANGCRCLEALARLSSVLASGGTSMFFLALPFSLRLPCECCWLRRTGVKRPAVNTLPCSLFCFHGAAGPEHVLFCTSPCLGRVHRKPWGGDRQGL